GWQPSSSPYSSQRPHLLEVDEFVVTGVAKVVVEPDPLRGFKKGFASKCPALQVKQLALTAITLNQNVFVLSHTFHFSKSRLKFKRAEVVKASQRNHQIELLVSIRERILSSIAKQAIPYRLRCIG